MSDRFNKTTSYKEAKRIAFEVTQDNPTAEALARLFELSLQDAVKKIETDPNLPDNLIEQLEELHARIDKLETYTHYQASASTVWDIVHNLGRHPSVSVVDSGGTVVFGEVQYLTSDTLRVVFTAGFAGKAYLN
jgi:prophage tail gpP-like protein